MHLGYGEVYMDKLGDEITSEGAEWGVLYNCRWCLEWLMIGVKDNYKDVEIKTILVYYI